MSAAPTPLGVAVASAMPPSAPTSIGVAPTPQPIPPVWPRSAQLTVAVLLALTLAVLGWHVWDVQRHHPRPTQLEAAALTWRVDLNRADRAQLLQLPGVGEMMAKRIEEYRHDHYCFRDVEELRNIQGIGPATFERLRHLVYVEPPEDEDDRPAPPTRSPRSTMLKKDELPSAPLDINKATADELQRLPSIGPTLSARIIEKRKEMPFKTVDDLRRVSGIGAKTLEKLRPYVTVAKNDPTKKD